MLCDHNYKVMLLLTLCACAISVQLQSAINLKRSVKTHRVNIRQNSVVYLNMLNKLIMAIFGCLPQRNFVDGTNIIIQLTKTKEQLRLQLLLSRVAQLAARAQKHIILFVWLGQLASYLCSNYIYAHMEACLREGSYITLPGLCGNMNWTKG